VSGNEDRIDIEARKARIAFMEKLRVEDAYYNKEKEKEKKKREV
jgi:hypothetical protein